MALACEDLGKPDDARQLWKEAEAEVATNSSEARNEIGVLAIAKARAGDVKTAYRLVESLGSRAESVPEGRDEYPELDGRYRNRCRVLQRIIADQFRRGDFKGGLESAAVLPESLADGSRPRDETLKIMGLYLWKSRQREFADQAMGRIQESWVMDELMSELIPVQLSLGEAAAAKTSWERITNKRGHVPVCIQIAVYLANHGNAQDAESLFTEAVALASEARMQFHAYVGGSFYIQQIGDLCRIAVAESSVKSPSMRSTLDSAIKLAKAEPNDAAWREVAVARAGCGMLADALQTVEFIKGVDERAKAQAGIAVVQADAGDRAGARDRFKMAAEMTTAVDQTWTRAQLVVSIVEQCAKAGELELAVELSGKIGPVVERERTMVALVKECLSAGDMKQAQMVSDHLSVDSFRRDADASIVKFKIKGGDLKGAYTVATMHGEVSDDVMFGLIQGQIIGKDYAGAVLSARTWNGEGPTGHTLGDVATELARAGDLQGALALIRPESGAVEKAFVWAGAACGLAQRHANRQAANEVIAGLDWGWPFPRNCGESGGR